MLESLAIRDIVLIEQLTLDFDAGLNVLTGATGAGKSILLDALGFALGRRDARGLVRAGCADGAVEAVIGCDDHHPARALLLEGAIDREPAGALRRRLGSS